MPIWCPVYLQKLRRETALRGHGFESLSVFQPKPPAGAGSPSPEYLEFPHGYLRARLRRRHARHRQAGRRPVRQIWQQWVQRLDALSERERVLIFLAGLAVVLAVAYLVGIEPALKQRRVLSARMTDQQAQLMAAGAQRQALARTLAQDPDAPVREQIAGKQRELAELDSQLAGLQRTLDRSRADGRGAGAADRSRAGRAPGVAA